MLSPSEGTERLLLSLGDGEELGLKVNEVLRGRGPCFSTFVFGELSAVDELKGLPEVGALVMGTNDDGFCFLSMLLIPKSHAPNSLAEEASKLTCVRSVETTLKQHSLSAFAAIGIRKT